MVKNLHFKSDGKILHGEAKDTTLLLWSKYVDPGVFVEDNASKTEDIVVTLDKQFYLSTKKDI